MLCCDGLRRLKWNCVHWPCIMLWILTRVGDTVLKPRNALYGMVEIPLLRFNTLKKMLVDLRFEHSDKDKWLFFHLTKENGQSEDSHSWQTVVRPKILFNELDVLSKTCSVCDSFPCCFSNGFVLFCSVVSQHMSLIDSLLKVFFLTMLRVELGILITRNADLF